MLISYLATPIMIASAIPQIYRLYKTKEANGVSVTMFYLTALAVALLLAEAIRLEAWVIMVADISSLFMLGWNIILLHKYKTKTGIKQANHGN